MAHAASGGGRDQVEGLTRMALPGMLPIDRI